LSLVRAAGVVGSNTMLSRVLGFVRDILMANVLGAGIVSDAFFVAFKIANFLRRLFAEGAFNAAFVPLFSRTLERDGRVEARIFAGEAFVGLALVLALVVALAEVFMVELVGVLAGGYGPDDPRFPLAVALSHITFPYILLISLTALLGGMLNALGRFGAAAFAPVLLNVVLIAALVVSPWLPIGPAHALAWGVTLAGVLQFAFLVRAAARERMLPVLVRPRWTPRLRRLTLLVLPGAVGAGVAQINMLVDLWFASHLAPGAQSYLFYADRLNQLPLGVVGIAVGTALLPLLSRELAAGRSGEARHALNRAIQLALLLTLPATAALLLIAEPIVVGLFERGAFTAADSRATAATVQAFAVGLPAYVLVKVLAPGFFAREDTRTPVAVAACALLANIALILVLIDALGYVGIALATALANWLNVVMLAGLLARAGYFRPDRTLAVDLARALAATAAMALVLLAVNQLAAAWPPLARLAALVLAGGASFALVALAVGAVPAELRRLVARRAAG